MDSDKNTEDLPVFKCDCGWTGTIFQMIPVHTPEGIWDKCPNCGNVTDDMEEIHAEADA